MTSAFGLTPAFVGLAMAPFFTPIPPIRGDQGIGVDVGETGSLVEVPLPPRRPAELGGRLAAGANEVYDFQTGFYGRRTGTPTATTTWRCKDVFTSGPSPWALTDAQSTRLRAIAAQLSGCYGIDLQHAFTTMNIESKFAHDIMLGDDDDTYKGPFQYGQIAYRAAFNKPDSYDFPLADFRSIAKQCRAFAIDTIRFTELLKRKGVTPEPWMCYMMHQQGPATGALLIKKSITAPTTNLRAYANRIGRRVWTNILANPQFSATISASSTVLQLCNIFKGKYISNRDGTGGFQPVTDYIEQVDITVPMGEASGQIPLADIIDDSLTFTVNNGVLKTAIDCVVPGEGMDLASFVTDNRVPPTATFKGRLAKLMLDPGRIVMMDLWWGPEIRTDFSIKGHFFLSFGADRRFHISQAHGYFLDEDSIEQSGPWEEKIAAWDVNPANTVSRGIGYDYDNGRYVIGDAIAMPYGDARIAWRPTATSLSIAVNGNDPVVLEAAQTIPEAALDALVLSAGYMKIRRIVGFPDNPDPNVLKYVSDHSFKVGTEAGLEPNLPV